MYDQTTFGTRQAQLFEDSDHGGYTQNRNNPPSQGQRPVLAQLGAGTDFWVSLELYSVVHGHMNRSFDQPASLIILEAKFFYVGHKTVCRFRSARLKMTFMDHEEPQKFSATLPNLLPAGRALRNRDQPCFPEIFSWAPFREQENYHPSKTEVEDSTEFTGEAGADMFGATIKASAKKGRKENYTVQYFSRGSSDHVANAVGQCDSVWWKLQESPDPKVKQKLGIRPNVLFAMLVERKSDAPFMGHFELEATAQSWSLSRKTWLDSTKGTMPQSDPVNFDPLYEPQGRFQGIDPAQLERFKNPYEMAQLVSLLRPLARPVESSEPLSPPSVQELQALENDEDIFADAEEVLQ